MFRACLSFVVLTALAAAPSLTRAADGGQPCGNIGYTGCCVDDTHRSYCSSKGVLVTTDCSKTAATPKCGWSTEKSYYTCVAAVSSDPSSKYPRLCSALPDGGPIPDPDRGVKQDSGTKKDTGTKKDSGEVIPCGSITAKGCCDSTAVVKYCSNGSLKTKDCTSQTKTPKCGWLASQSFYTCTSDGKADPSGSNPMACGTSSVDLGGTAADQAVSTSDTGSTTVEDSGAATTDLKGTTTKPKDDGGCAFAAGSPRGLLLLLGLVLGTALGGLIARRSRRR